MSKSKRMFSEEEFNALLPTLTNELAFELERELAACMLPELGGQPASGLWDLPTVDSKTVCKLSPITQKLLDRRLEPSWVRKGGYESVEEAVRDVVAHAKHDCVLEKATVSATSPESVSISFRRGKQK